MITIGQGVLSITDFTDIVFNNKPVSLSPSALKKIEANFEFLKNFSSNKLIYGINTGFGPMAQYKVSDENLLNLQYNLIRSHSSGSGALLTPVLARALMLARLNSLVQAYSGVHTDIIELLVALINNHITPCIYEHGGVGASGDLVQLAHLGLVLIGEGEVIYDGETHPTLEIFNRLNIKPLTIHVREGLATINGTSAMTGIGMVNIIKAQKLLGWAAMFSAMTNEVVGAYDDHYSHELNIVKHHTGQNKIAAMLRDILKGSKMIRSRTEHLYHPDNIDQEVFEDKVQEYYSLRCVTQVLGPIYDTITQAENVLVNELNSVNDNPVIDHINQNVFHGGNFHGDYVSLEMDKLKIAITKLSMLSERQLNYLLNDKLNQKFPPFVNLGVLGLNFGMQGVQFTATSTVAENQTLSFPMYVHSIPNNNDNQDIVSMGCNAALMTGRVIDNSFTVLTIQLMTILQAIDYLGCQDKLAPNTQALYNEVRNIFPKFIEDTPKYKDIERVKGFLSLAPTPLQREGLRWKVLIFKDIQNSLSFGEGWGEAMKCALVTGGSRGIGRAICVKMAAMGYYVLINYKSNTIEANKTLQLVKENSGDGELLQFDVADKEQIKAILGGWINKNENKSIEVLVNNAGVRDDSLMVWLKDEQWDNVIKTSLDSFFYVTRLVLDGMMLNRYGRIVNVVSLSGLKGLPGQTNYSAAKAGVIGATKALAQEVGRSGITVNAVAPGFIKTDMTEGLDEKELKKAIPVNRFGLPEEVAHAVGFLASKDAAYITGEVLSINGGLYS